MAFFQGNRATAQLITIDLGCPVQRLSSTLPHGGPGVGLLLVRLSLATALIYVGGAGFLLKAANAITLVENMIAVAGGVLLLAGLWTPLAGGLVALEETGQV